MTTEMSATALMAMERARVQPYEQQISARDAKIKRLRTALVEVARQLTPEQFQELSAETGDVLAEVGLLVPSATIPVYKATED